MGRQHYRHLKNCFQEFSPFNKVDFITYIFIFFIDTYFWLYDCKWTLELVFLTLNKTELVGIIYLMHKQFDIKSTECERLNGFHHILCIQLLIAPYHFHPWLNLIIGQNNRNASSSDPYSTLLTLSWSGVSCT